MRFRVWLSLILGPMGVQAQVPAGRPKPACWKEQLICLYSRPDTTLVPVTESVIGLHLWNAEYHLGWLSFTKDNVKPTARKLYTPVDEKLYKLIHGAIVVPYFMTEDPNVAYKRMAAYVDSVGGHTTLANSIAQSGKESAGVKKLYAAEPKRTTTQSGEVSKKPAKVDTVMKTDSAAIKKLAAENKSLKHVADSAKTIVDMVTEVNVARKDSIERQNKVIDSLTNAAKRAEALVASRAEIPQDTGKKKVVSQKKIPIGKEEPPKRAPVAPKPRVDTVTKTDTVTRVDTVTKHDTVSAPQQAAQLPYQPPAPPPEHHEISCWKHFSWCTGTVGAAALAGAFVAVDCAVRKDHCGNAVDIQNNNSNNVNRTVSVLQKRANLTLFSIHP